MSRAEMLFFGGPIYVTGTTKVEALAIGGGKVLAAGSRAEVEAAAGPHTRRIDLGGRVVVPGLVDAHLHLLSYGMNLDKVQLAGVFSLRETLERVAARAAKTPPGQWILGRGWDQDRWAERRYPTLKDLDAVTPHHPVLLRRACGHISIANSLALRLAGVTRDTQAPQGGSLDRDAHGEPTGILRETAARLVQDVIPEPTYAELQRGLELAVKDALRFGITDVHTDDCRYGGGLEQTLRLYQTMCGPECYPLRAYLLIGHMYFDELLARGLRRGDGNGWVRIGMVKLFADGSLGGRTATLLEDYADDPGNRGLFIWPEDEFYAMVERYHAAGYQLGIHCIGDAATQLMLDAVDRAQAKHRRQDHRHRVIHAQILSPSLILAMKKAGVVGDIQPKFIQSDGYWFQDRVGPERALTSYAWKTMLEAGIPLCGGSDCPVEPLNMMWQLHAAVTRRDLNGHPGEAGWNPAERLTVAEAIDLHTQGAAYAAFEERVKGKLLPGFAADLAVLDRDPAAIPPHDIQHIQVHMTVVGGRIGYEV